MAATTLAIGMLRMKQKDWRPKSFAQEAQEIYKTMNDAFAKGDRETLKVVCTPSMFSVSY
jgi:predicted lipid-binding transport protein (Tim44 family)